MAGKIDGAGSSSCVDDEIPEQDLDEASGSEALTLLILCPTPEDEPTKLLRLSGNSISGSTEVCGWSKQTPLKFGNVHESTKFKAMYNSGGRLVEAVNELKGKCMKPVEVKGLVGCVGQVNRPVHVQVIAKRKASVVLCSSRLLVIPLIVVADDSGYCVLCSCNEGLETVYKSVNVGDLLLLTSYIPQKCRNEYHSGLFADNMFLDLKLKVQYHSVRNHYLGKFAVQNLADFKLPAALYDASCQLKTPSELEKEFEKEESSTGVASTYAGRYYDLIGVIVYVSRIKRFKEAANQPAVECLVQNETRLVPFERFVTVRWIKLIDKNSRPIPVKLFNLALDLQAALVPGAVIVVSHCLTQRTAYSSPHSYTSQFSEVYYGTELEKYYLLHPSSFFTEGSKTLYARSTYVGIMSRTDCNWSIGGMPTIKLDEGFRNWYLSHEHLVQPGLWKLARRESRRLYFKGLIMRAVIVQEQDIRSVYYVHQRFSDIRRQRLTLCSQPSDDIIADGSWYSFMRRLPPINPSVFQLPSCREIMKEITNSFEGYCGPLLMPAIIDDHQLALATGLERVDGPPYFMLDIFDEAKNDWHLCVWKPCAYTMEEMTAKVNLVKQKQILCLAEHFCVEKRTRLELTLHDFVLADAD